MQTRNLSLRIILGLALFIIGIASLFIIFGPHGLRIPFENRPLFILAIFAVSTAIGFGAYLFSGYPLQKFLEPFLIMTFWTFFIFLPIWLSPLPKDISILMLGFSPFLALLLWIGYSKLKERITGKRENHKW